MKMRRGKNETRTKARCMIQSATFSNESHTRAKKEGSLAHQHAYHCSQANTSNYRSDTPRDSRVSQWGWRDFDAITKQLLQKLLSRTRMQSRLVTWWQQTVKNKTRFCSWTDWKKKTFLNISTKHKDYENKKLHHQQIWSFIFRYYQQWNIDKITVFVTEKLLKFMDSKLLSIFF